VKILFADPDVEGSRYLCKQLFDFCWTFDQTGEEDVAEDVLWRMSEVGVLLNPKTARKFTTRKQMRNWFQKLKKEHTGEA